MCLNIALRCSGEAVSIRINTLAISGAGIIIVVLKCDSTTRIADHAGRFVTVVVDLRLNRGKSRHHSNIQQLSANVVKILAKRSRYMGASCEANRYHLYGKVGLFKHWLTTSSCQHDIYYIIFNTLARHCEAWEDWNILTSACHREVLKPSLLATTSCQSSRLLWLSHINMERSVHIACHLLRVASLPIKILHS